MAKNQTGRPKKENRRAINTTPTAFICSLELKEKIDLYSETNNVSRSKLVRDAILEKFAREGFCQEVNLV